MPTLHESGDLAVLGEMKHELAHFGFAHFCGWAHEMLGKVSDAVQVGSDGVRAVAFEEEIGFHLFLKFPHGFPPGERF